MTRRLDRNGIPILDPPRNGLRTRCHPAMHRWVRDEMREEAFDVDNDPAYGVKTLTTVALVCAVCGAMDSETQVRAQKGKGQGQG